MEFSSHRIFCECSWKEKAAYFFCKGQLAVWVLLQREECWFLKKKKKNDGVVHSALPTLHVVATVEREGRTRLSRTLIALFTPGSVHSGLRLCDFL